MPAADHSARPRGHRSRRTSATTPRRIAAATNLQNVIANGAMLRTARPAAT
jgi:hypothetical protein